MKVFYTDVDGVLLSIWDPFFQWIYDRTGKWFNEDHFTQWDVFDQFGLTKNETGEAWKRIWDTPARVRTGAYHFVRQLQDIGYHVVGISHRERPAAVEAAKRDFDQLGLDYWYLTTEKGAYISNSEGEPYFFLDDKAANVLDVYQRCYKRNEYLRCYLYRSAHNTPNYNVLHHYQIVGPEWDYITAVARDRWSD